MSETLLGLLAGRDSSSAEPWHRALAGEMHSSSLKATFEHNSTQTLLPWRPEPAAVQAPARPPLTHRFDLGEKENQKGSKAGAALPVLPPPQLWRSWMDLSRQEGSSKGCQEMEGAGPRICGCCERQNLHCHLILEHSCITGTVHVTVTAKGAKLNWILPCQGEKLAPKSHF